jgi:hypothetical protein
VNFEKLNERFSDGKYVPVVGDLMISRWAYEALLVSQFRFNDYQSRFFEVEKEMSNVQFDYLFVIPELKETLSFIRVPGDEKSQSTKLKYLQNGLLELHQNNPQITLPEQVKKVDSALYFIQIEKYLDKLNNLLWNQNKRMSKFKDSIVHELIVNSGSAINYNIYKNKYSNKNLSEFLLKRQSLAPYIRNSREMVRKLEPVYQNSTSNYGRAQFLAADKRIGSYLIMTPLFNIIAIWIMSIFVLVALLYFSKNQTRR